MKPEIKLFNGIILCELCDGAGKIFTHGVEPERCMVCDGNGTRKPTWSEKITLRDRLKDCIYNYGLEKY